MKGRISAGHELTARAGAEMLRAGGNAFDATVAASFASFVVESALTSPAGGGFLVSRSSGGRVRLYDFFSNVPGLGREPGAGGLNFFKVGIDFADATQYVYVGEGAAAVPGVVAGLAEVYRQHCTLPLKELLAPAIEYARGGVVLTEWQAYFNGLLAPMQTVSEEAMQLYEPHGVPLDAGELIVNTLMADAFEYLAREGLERFYDGDIAHLIVKGFGERGLITAEDLSAYRVDVREPLRFSYRDRTVYTNPPPSSGGTLIAFSMKLLEGFDVRAAGHNTAEGLSLLVDAMRVTNEARAENLDTRVYEDGIELEFLSSGHVSAYRGRMSGDYGASAAQEGSSGNTTQISVIDAEGNVAGLTTSTGMGCGFMIPGTGIMMNNMLGERDLNPGGFHAQPPGVRMSSMMAPTIVTRDGEPEIVLGSGGSKRIRSAILQSLVNIIDHGMDVHFAVDAPRVHFEDGVLDVESGIPKAALATLEYGGVRLKRWGRKNMYFGGVHAVVSTGAGLSGAGDARRGGVSVEA